ncbi:hypothetical protein Vretifemale_8729, partial [Volvox reticuliferus]
AGGGAAARGISGGERRRVTIGMELVISPRLLVLDEPTSGLDSWAASNLMRTCKAVASNGRVVVMSLHQPSPDMVALLDRLMVLAAGGRQAFFEAPSAAAAHCEAAGWPCPPGRAICEHMLQLANRSTAAAALVAAAKKAPGSSVSTASAVMATAPTAAAAKTSQEVPVVNVCDVGVHRCDRIGSGRDGFGSRNASCEGTAAHKEAGITAANPPALAVADDQESAALYSGAGTESRRGKPAATPPSSPSTNDDNITSTVESLAPSPARQTCADISTAAALAASRVAARRTDTPAPWDPGYLGHDSRPAGVGGRNGGGRGRRISLGARLKAREAPGVATRGSPITPSDSHGGDGGDDATVATRPSSPSTSTGNTWSPRAWHQSITGALHKGSPFTSASNAASATATAASSGQGSGGCSGCDLPPLEAKGDDYAIRYAGAAYNTAATAGAAISGRCGTVVVQREVGDGREKEGEATAAGGGAASCTKVTEVEAGGRGRAYAMRRWWRSCCLMFWRCGVDMARTPGLLVLHCGLAVAAGCVVGLIFLRQKRDLTGMQNAAGTSWKSELA